MKRRRKTVIAAAALGTVIAAGAGIAAANGRDNGRDDAETPIGGPDLERASSAALAHTGEGRVTGTEVGDEESYYEVEVTLTDGSQVDVQLDEGFIVVRDIPDQDTDADGR